MSPLALVKPLVAPPLVLAFLCATASNAAAADVSAVHCKGVTVSSGALRIGGVLSDPESFKGALRVKATRKGRKPYFLPNGELVSTTSSERRIPPGKVEIANSVENALPFDPKKGKGRWRSIPVTIHDVRFEGTYRGGLELGSGGCKVELVVTAQGGAEISLVGTGTASGPKAVKLKLVNCGHVSCLFGDSFAWLNTSSSRKDTVMVQVDNTSQSPAVITGVQVALNSEVGEEIAPDDAFVPERQTFIRPAQTATTLPPIDIDRGKIDPGHYSGAIFLTVAGAEKRTVLPFEVDVKDGPTLAILVLFAAYLVHVIGAAVKYAKARNSAPRRVSRTRKKAKAELGADAVLVEPRLDHAEAMARRGHLSEAELECARVAEDIERVAAAQAAEEAAMSTKGELPPDVAEKAETFQAAVRQGGASEEHLKALKREAESKAGAKDEGEIAKKRTQTPKGRSELANVIVKLGVYVLPWVLRGILVVAFLLAGLKELYFANSTFGAQPAADYVALFLWGLSGAALDILVGKFLPGDATT